MDSKILELKKIVGKEVKNPRFIHHKWFVKYHLDIVEKLSLELCELYKDADRNLVLVIVWLHDYGKIVDSEKEHEITLTKEKGLLKSLGFDDQFSDKVVSYLETLERKIPEEIRASSIEVQIVSSTDGAAHFIGPFFSIWFYENSRRDLEDLMTKNIEKAIKDWERKIVLPEVKKIFQKRFEFVLEQNGKLKGRYIK